MTIPLRNGLTKRDSITLGFSDSTAGTQELRLWPVKKTIAKI